MRYPIRSRLALAALLAFTSVTATSAYNVVDRRESQYDVDRNGRAETRVISEFIQDTWLNLPMGRFGAMYWVESGLIDFNQVDFTWGPPPNPPGISGSLNAWRILGATIGSQGSNVVWTSWTSSSSFNILSAPAVFNIQNCTITGCTTISSVTLSTQGRNVADYHQPTSPGSGGGGGGGGPGSRLAPAALEAGALEVMLQPGETLETGANIDAVDLAARELVESLFEFRSSVTAGHNGTYTYTYTARNLTDFTADLTWLLAEAAGVELVAAGSNDTYTHTFVSSFAPVETTDGATVNFDVGRGFDIGSVGGAVPMYAPVPVPPALPLFGAALAWVMLLARRRSPAASER